ncbi:transporter substrate-binding domain-containing protein [uncultured Brachyspira sp.]|uniref:transporter substrate-binding domain-containing protein n=1 Tax=uncultured Brachyspira sp. TaxID=221953 RepID=UPI0025EA8B07|nr:transporter substrate-binding domain-containing protein [uncultured Brachyspira sp.]
MRNILLKVVLSICLAAVLSCSKEDSDVLYVGTNAEYPPFEYLDENGNVAGFDIDLMNEIAKIIGKKIEIKDMTFDGLIPALEANTIDIIIAGMTVNESKKKIMNFSIPYYEVRQNIIVLDNNTDITNLSSLNNKRVAVVLGYRADNILSTNEAVTLERYNRTADTVLALQSGKVDAAVMDSPVAIGYVKNNEGLKIVDTYSDIQELAIGFRKKDVQLMEDVNNAMNILQTNGVYDSLLEKYF